MSLDKNQKKKVKKGRPVKTYEERSEWSREHREPDTGKYSPRRVKLDEDKIKAFIIENYYDMTYKDMAFYLHITKRQLESRVEKLLKSGTLKSKKIPTIYAKHQESIRDWVKTLDKKDLDRWDKAIEKEHVIKERLEELKKERALLPKIKIWGVFPTEEETKKRKELAKKNRPRLLAFAKEERNLRRRLSDLIDERVKLEQSLRAPKKEEKKVDKKYFRIPKEENFLIKPRGDHNIDVGYLKDNPAHIKKTITDRSPDFEDGEYVILDFWAPAKSRGRGTLTMGKLKEDGRISYVQRGSIDDYLVKQLKKKIPPDYEFSKDLVRIKWDVDVVKGTREKVKGYKIKISVI